MAEPDMRDPDRLGHRHAVHRHGIGVVQQQAILRPDRGDVPGDRVDHRDRAQRPEHASDAQRVADRLQQAELPRDLEIDDCTRLVAADLDRADHVVRVPARFLLAQRRFDPHPGFQLGHHPARHRLRDFQARGVDVHQADCRVPQLGGLQDVADEIFCEDNRPGTDERDFGIHEGSNFAFSHFHARKKL